MNRTDPQVTGIDVSEFDALIEKSKELVQGKAICERQDDPRCPPVPR